MKMTFKEQMAVDIKNVFHNANEFAETTELLYNGKTYTVPIIIEHENADDRQRYRDDGVNGIFNVDIRLYISLADFGVVPKKGHSIEFNDEIYNIKKSSCEGGEIIIELEMLDE